MLNKLKKSNGEGFTIIEVMIVLAIAGLILLIVFLAVPALQRSSRNTQRKNDAASLLAAVSNYISNNNGQVPATAQASGTDEQICGANCAGGNTETAKLGFYTGGSGVTLVKVIPAAFPGTNNITILVGYTCPSASGTMPAAAQANPRSAVALFSLESGGNQTNVCQEQ